MQIRLLIEEDEVPIWERDENGKTAREVAEKQRSTAYVQEIGEGTNTNYTINTARYRNLRRRLRHPAICEQQLDESHRIGPKRLLPANS
jgi:hypothetical protein